MQYIKAYFLTILVFLAIDSVWLGKIATTFYQERIGHLMADTFSLKVAAVFYLIYIAGLVFFAVRPGLKEGAVKTALICGGLYGFFCYATYDVTNLATLRDWPVDMVIIDLIWVTVLSGSAAAVSTWILLKLKKA